MRGGCHCSLVVVSAAIAMAVLSSCNSSARADKKRVADAENEVYAAVVHDMTSSAKRSSQLVFDDALLTRLAPGSDMKSCEESVGVDLGLENNNTPEYNSVADKLYRLINEKYDDSVNKDSIKDFLEKLCTPGHLSRSFHTDLPKAFISGQSVVTFGDLIVRPTSFEQMFPGANGVVSFSHVGFDSTLHDAIVDTSFVCGGLCGSGHMYILRKIRGHWQVVNKWMVWAS